MRKAVRCAWRVHSKGEVLEGVFDTEEGVVKECPSLFTLETAGLDYSKDEYVVEDAPFSFLAKMMNKYPDAIAAVGYYKKGAIIVKHKTAIFAKGGEIDSDSQRINLLKEYNRTVETLGLVKTIVYDISYTTKQALLLEDTTDKFPVVHTRQACKIMSADHDVIPAGSVLSMARVLEMSKIPEVYGSCVVNGKPVLVELSGGVIREYKGEEVTRG